MVTGGGKNQIPLNLGGMYVFLPLLIFNINRSTSLSFSYFLSFVQCSPPPPSPKTGFFLRRRSRMYEDRVEWYRELGSAIYLIQPIFSPVPAIIGITDPKDVKHILSREGNFMNYNHVS